ncbi:OTU deubiquitinase with linear linkage specificity a [Chiloscyllium plagiosum]|uniref:OTU deubiquitinase with linear linkage specificity a n=1 Tax=Chiloscyllium plagiosum TaxID=36176 RepID=UPI001CB82C0A|nr:OTU deubiquitinase with linear linkage specificity a [Chiloscyllium plagiosum]
MFTTGRTMWRQDVNQSDDVFDEEADELRPSRNEWNICMGQRLKEGYRDGVNAGRESTLQHGFNQGYQEGVKKMLVLSQIKGLLSALLSWFQLNGSDPNLLTKVNQLLGVATQQEELIFRNLCVSPKETSVTDVMECIEDMSLDTLPEKQPDVNSYTDAASEIWESGNETGNPDSGINSTLSHLRSCRTAPGIESEMVKQLCQDCALLLKDCELPSEIALHFQLQP